MNEAQQVIKEVFGKNGVKALDYCASNNHSHALVITGPQGSGKTILMDLLAKTHGDDIHSLDLWAASDAGVAKYVRESELVLIDRGHLNVEQIYRILNLADGKPVVLIAENIEQYTTDPKYTINLTLDNHSHENKQKLMKALGY